ncbi:MAG: sugar transferase [Chloroflexi bacterium]|nr:sugar transferase [Chloroflexota bacterium]MCI0729504.1 sugar transferase [Chloroflexota bacterium]
MIHRFSVNFAVLSLIFDTGLTLLALIIAGILRPVLPLFPFVIRVPAIQIPVYLYLVVPLLWACVLFLASVYDPKRTYRVVDELQVVTLAVGLATLILAGLLYFFLREFSRWLLVLFVVLNLIFLLGWRLLARPILKLLHVPPAESRVLIVGAGRCGQRMGEMIRAYEWTGLRLTGYLDDDPAKRDQNLPILGRVEEVRQVVERMAVDDVVIALPQWAYARINELVLKLHDLPVRVQVIPDYFSLALYRASVNDFGGLPMISLRDPALNDVERLMKRLFDLVVSGFLILATLPLMAFIALILKAASPGPVLFRQERIGENGRPFTMYKFRSMIVGAEKQQESMNEVTPEGYIIFKKANDPRITRIGRFLRRTSLDELPQLFNVLKGEMSMVGPRPELPWLVNGYEMWQRKRFAVPQGITGWWQVNGRANKPMHLNTEDDLYYIQNYSLWMDVYILLKTLWVVLRGTGAY